MSSYNDDAAFLDWFTETPAVNNIRTLLAQSEVNCLIKFDKFDDLYDVWRDNPGAEFRFGIVHMRRVLTAREPGSAKGRTYPVESWLTMSPMELRLIEERLNTLSSLYKTLVPMYKVVKSLHGALHEAAFETCHVCCTADDICGVGDGKSTEEMSEPCRSESGRNRFVNRWRKTLADSLGIMSHDKAPGGRFKVIRRFDLVEPKFVVAYQTMDFDKLKDAEQWIERDMRGFRSKMPCKDESSLRQKRCRWVSYPGPDGHRLYAVWNIVEFPNARK